MNIQPSALLDLVKDLRQPSTETIGTYYFPGWKNNAGYPAGVVYPWTPIQNIRPERIPLKGPYSDGVQGVVDRQLLEMGLAGLKFVVPCWYWEADVHAATNHRRAAPRMNHFVNGWKKSPFKNLVDLAIMCTNDGAYGWPDTLQNWTRMADYWVTQLFSEPTYMRIDGKPVVFIYDVYSLFNRAAAIGTTAKLLLDDVRDRAIAGGHPGVFFVGLTDNLTHWIGDRTADSPGVLQPAGFDMTTSYNYHFYWLAPFDGSARSPLSSGYLTPATEGHPTHHETYMIQWDHALIRGTLPVMLNMSAGWDATPWGSSSAEHNLSAPASSEEFRIHLLAARDRMRMYPERTKGYGIITCWNEFGEGSYIEPNGKYGNTFLKEIRRTFGG